MLRRESRADLGMALGGMGTWAGCAVEKKPVALGASGVLTQQLGKAHMGMRRRHRLSTWHILVRGPPAGPGNRQRRGGLCGEDGSDDFRQAARRWGSGHGTAAVLRRGETFAALIQRLGPHLHEEHVVLVSTNLTSLQHAVQLLDRHQRLHLVNAQGAGMSGSA